MSHNKTNFLGMQQHIHVLTIHFIQFPTRNVFEFQQVKIFQNIYFLISSAFANYLCQMLVFGQIQDNIFNMFLHNGFTAGGKQNQFPDHLSNLSYSKKQKTMRLYVLLSTWHFIKNSMQITFKVKYLAVEIASFIMKHPLLYLQIHSNLNLWWMTMDFQMLIV